MMKKSTLVISLLILFTGAAGAFWIWSQQTETSKSDESCGISCMAKTNVGEAMCKLPPAELQARKEAVLPVLKSKLIEKKELEDGYAFQFPGDDSTYIYLADFIRAERRCCDFLVYNLSISGDQSEIWLELRGGKEAKEFIEREMNF